MIESNWAREATFNSNVVLLDGLTGTGKTMIMKLLDTYDSVTPPKFNYQFEQILIGIDIEGINKDLGLQIIQLLLDQMKYDLAIGREINLRPRDLSSMLSSQKRFAYLFNMLRNDGNSVKNRIQTENQDLLIVTHQILDAAKVISSISGKSLTHILCVRHPYFLVSHWESYIPMHGNSPTDFTLVNGTVPWFIKEFKNLYVDSNTKERAMISIIELLNKSLDYIEQDPADLVVIDFENFVLHPFVYLERLSSILSDTNQNRLSKVLREQKLPRKHINDTIVRSIYQRYASDQLTTKYQHEEDYIIMRDRTKENVSSEIHYMFECLARRYESKFGLWF